MGRKSLQTEVHENSRLERVSFFGVSVLDSTTGNAVASFPSSKVAHYKGETAKTQISRQ
jgi:hypothetical protein